jgi:predicted amidophosphoribosyltransferase
MDPSRSMLAVGRELLALLAPPRCLACRRLGPALLELGLCGSCRLRLESRANVDVRPVEGLDGLICATSYEGPALGLVSALKGGGNPIAARASAELISAATGRLAEGVALVPVGPSRRRRLLRGADPGEALAAALSAALGVSWIPLLRRLGTGRQRGRSREARLTDPPRFAVIGTPPRRSLLVDDVVTTGGTLRSAASTLCSAGCESVSAAVLARTPPPAARPGCVRT